MKQLPEILQVGRDLLYSLSPLAPARQRNRITVKALFCSMVKPQAQDLQEGLPMGSHLSTVRHAHKPLFGVPVLIQLQGHISSIRWPLVIKGAQCQQERKKSGVMRSVEVEFSGKKKRKRKNQTWNVSCVPPWIGSSSHAFSSR